MKLFFFILLTVFGILDASSQPSQEYCQRFNGSQLLQLRNATQLNLGNTFTLEAWVYLETASPYGIIVGKTFNPRGNDPFQNYVLSLDGSGLKVEFVQTTGMSGSYTSVTSPTSIPLNTWTHIAATLSGGQMRLFINGNEVNNRTSPGNPAPSSTVPFSVGSGATPTFETACCGIMGSIMQVRVWSTALSAATIKTNSSLQLTGTESGLLAYWPMNESSGQLIMDMTPNGHHLTRGTTTTTDPADPTHRMVTQLGTFFSYSYLTLPVSNGTSEDIYLIDYNADGKKDLIVSSLRWPPTIPATFTPMRAIKNNGSMNFVLDNGINGYDSLVHARDYVTADFDGNGKEDLFIADHGTDIAPFPGGQNRIYFSNNNGKITEASAGNIPQILDFSHHTASADIDKDGDIDLYVCNIYNNLQTGPYFLINNGNGQFSVRNNNIPSTIANLSEVYMSSRFADIDNDGDEDLLLGAIDNSGLAKDILLLNNGSGVFTKAINTFPNRYGNNQWGTVAMSVFDVNNDGYKDVLMSTLYQYQTCHLQLLVNNKNGTFSDSTKNIPQSWGTTNTWIKWIERADFNNDGWTDFLVSTLGGSHRLYMNKGATQFEEASSILNIEPNIASYRVNDFDGDGLTDIAFVSFSGKLTFAKNLKPFPVQLAPGVTTSLVERNRASQWRFITYPNPAVESIIIEVDENVSNYNVRLLNLQGQIIKDFGKRNGRINTLQINNTPAGVYLLQLIKDNRLMGVQKIVITK